MLRAEPSTADSDRQGNELRMERRDRVTSWVNNFGDELYGWASHKIGDASIAQDVVQETFIAAFQHYDTFTGRSSPKTWLLSILNNKIIDHYRKSARGAQSFRLEERFSELDFQPNGMWKDDRLVVWDTESSLLDNPDFSRTLEQCMDKLPTSWRSVVNAKYLLEKDSKEICQELDITPSNYWQVLHRAKLTLKRCIELHWFDK